MVDDCTLQDQSREDVLIHFGGVFRVASPEQKAELLAVTGQQWQVAAQQLQIMRSAAFLQHLRGQTLEGIALGQIDLQELLRTLS